MAEGLGMTNEEWKELRSQVDNSFWVMRVIGESRYTLSSGYIQFMLFVQATLHFRTTTTASHVVRIGTEFCIFASTIAYNGCILRDYGCLTYAGRI